MPGRYRVAKPNEVSSPGEVMVSPDFGTIYIQGIDAGTYYNLAVKSGSVYILPDRDMKFDVDRIITGVNGREHILVLTGESGLYAFGENAFGQLGNGGFEGSDEFVKIMDGVAQVAAGASHSLALKPDGTLWAWGGNANGQVGNGNTENQPTPVKVLDNVVQISARSNNSAAMTADGAVYVWGSNASGQLGNGGITQSNVPLLVDISDDIASDWAYPGISATKKIGLVPSEIANKYRSNITRKEFASLAVNLYGSLTGKTAVYGGQNPFNDVNDPAVTLAYELGIVKGEGEGRFNPNSAITRQEICVMLVRAMTAANPSLDVNIADRIDFTDGEYIDDWAEDSIQFAYANGIMLGVGEKTIDPLGNTTREQSIVLSFRIYENN